MGLFGGVSQVEYDRLKEDFNILKFTNSCEEFKSSHAMLMADMKYSVGRAAGMITAISELIEQQMYSTAKTVFEAVESQIVDTINSANKSHSTIINSMQTFSPEITRAYIQHLRDTAAGAMPLHEQINEANDLIKSTINMFNKMRDVLS